MAGWKVVNLEELEDVSVAHGLSPDMSARFARGPLEAEGTGLSLQRYAPNFRSPFGHKHATQEELYVVTAGGGRLKLDDEVVEVRRWDVVRVSPPVMRGIEAGPEGLELLVFGAPSTGGRDAETTMGWWAPDEPAAPAG